MEIERSVLGRSWRLRTCDETLALAISQRHGVPELVGRIACHAARRPQADVILGLEMSADNQPVIDAYFASDGAEAAVDALRQVPVMNASLDANNVVSYHRQINVGIAVALDWGLIVPVIKAADEKNLLGIAKSIALGLIGMSIACWAIIIEKILTLRTVNERERLHSQQANG